MSELWDKAGFSKEYQALIVLAHSAESAWETHYRNECLQCLAATEDEDCCETGQSLIDQSERRWDTVYNHPEWKY